MADTENVPKISEEDAEVEKHIEEKDEKHEEVKEIEIPQEKTEGQDEKKFPKNTIVRFIGIAGEISHDDIKKRVLEIDPSLDISSIHYESGDKEGILKFMKEDDGKKFIAKLKEGKMKVGELDMAMTLLEGDKEVEFFKNKLEKNEHKRKNDDENGADEVPAKQPKEDTTNKNEVIQIDD